MKKLLKENKGFSLVELLVALLIMAVIAGTAITLFGGVLETSKVRADNETAESVKRSILTYMNASNDINLKALGMVTGSNDVALIKALTGKTVITTGGAINGSTTTVKDPNAIEGDYGPYLEKEVTPTQNGKNGWTIKVNPITMVISVEATSGGSLTIN